MTDHFDPDGLRLSDDDRMHALNVLSEHYAAGRLDVSEFYDRSAEVAAARTLGALHEPFHALPGGLPLAAVDGHLRRLPVGGGLEPVDAGSPRTTDDELASLRKRGGLVDSLDGIILGTTLVVFLVLQLVVEWSYAWIVWPTLAVTLSVPRLLLRFGDAEEEMYEELKEIDAESRQKRLAQAAERIGELERKRDDR